MSKNGVHIEKAKTFLQGAETAASAEMQVEAWFLSAYHWIEACAARHRLHIQKHQRVPEELERNRKTFGDRTDQVVQAFRYLDNEARAKFVYGSSGTPADLERARRAFNTIRSICEEVLG